jgi:hypothetical protein
VEKILAHIERPPTPIGELRSDVPDDLARVLAKMLAKDPAKRFQTPAAVAQALAPFASGTAAVPRRPAATGGRRRWPIAVGALAAALLISLAAVVLHIQTEQGTIVVETDDPNIEVFVTQAGKVVSIVNQKTGYKVTLHAGEYEVALGPEAKGVKLTTDRFTLTRDGKTVKVWREPPPPPPLPPLPPLAPPVARPPVRIVADWKFAVDADGKPVRDGQVLGARMHEPARLNDGIRNIFQGNVHVDGGGPKYVAYDIPKDRPDMDGFALQTGPDHGAIFFPHDPDEELSTNEDFSVWMRIKLLGLRADHQTLMCRPGRWTLFLWQEGQLELGIWSWKDKLWELFTRQAAPQGKHPTLGPLLHEWVDVGFSFDGHGIDRMDDTVKVYVNGHRVGMFTGAAKWSFGDVVHLGMYGGGGERPDALYDRVIFYHGVLDDDGFRKLSLDKNGKLPKPPPMTDQIGAFVGHDDLAMCVAFTPDGKQLLTGSYDRKMRLWDVATRQTVRVYNNEPDGGRTVAFFKNGRRFIVGGDGCRTVRIWDVDQDRFTVETEPGPAGITCVALSPDEKHMLSAGYAPEVMLWDAVTGKTVGRMPLERGPIWSVAFSPTERLALSGAGDGRPRLWDLDTLKEVRAFGKPGDPVRSVAFTPDGKRALTSSFDGSLRLWEVATGKELHVFAAGTSINQIAVTRDGRFAVTAGHHDHLGRVWDLDKLQPVASWRHAGPLEGVTVSPDGRLAATCARDGTVRLWRMPQP